jgi:TetR/AcrR family transcriptional repressor of nem operon
MKQKPASGTGNVGRPISFDRAQAIRAAMDVFWKRGYLDVSASELADAMALQRSSFYNSFGSREEVFDAVLSAYRACAPDAALDRLKPGDPVVPVIVQVFREACEANAADEQARGCLLCNAIGELIGVDDAVGPIVAAAVDARMASIERLLTRAVKQGEMPAPANLKATARAVMAFLVGLNTLSKVVRSERQLWAMSKAFLEGIGIIEPA